MKKEMQYAWLSNETGYTVSVLMIRSFVFAHRIR